MPSGWRVQKARHAATAFSGEGARRWRGRWNSRGVAVVYLSSHQSLAALEVLVRIRPLPSHGEYVLCGAEWDEKLMEVFPTQHLPADWRMLPPSPSTAAIGDLWAREARSVVLAVPSAIIPAESNFLLNPAHPNFRQIRIWKSAPFEFDPRLMER